MKLPQKEALFQCNISSLINHTLFSHNSGYVSSPSPDHNLNVAPLKQTCLKVRNRGFPVEHIAWAMTVGNAVTVSPV